MLGFVDLLLWLLGCHPGPSSFGCPCLYPCPTGVCCGTLMASELILSWSAFHTWQSWNLKPYENSIFEHVVPQSRGSHHVAETIWKATGSSPDGDSPSQDALRRQNFCGTSKWLLISWWKKKIPAPRFMRKRSRGEWFQHVSHPIFSHCFLNMFLVKQIVSTVLLFPISSCFYCFF